MRDITNIDAYLHDEAGQYNSSRAAEMFNLLDMIFIEGDYNYLPWQKRSHKLVVFVNMCVRTNKRLFASQGAFESLVYLCAIGTDKYQQILQTNDEMHENSKFETAPSEVEQSEIKQNVKEVLIDAPLTKQEIANQLINYKEQIDGLDAVSFIDRCKEGSFSFEDNSQIEQNLILNRVTGDVYMYQEDTKKYHPKRNVGLHHFKTAQIKYHEVGKHILKVPTYRPAHYKQSERCLTSMKETQCQIKSQHKNHYLFEQFDKTFFLMQKQSQYEAHSFKILDQTKMFQILAENRQGPQVFSFNQNVVGCGFQIGKMYPETTMILDNYLNYQIQDFINNQNENIEMIECKDDYGIWKKYTEQISQQDKRTDSRLSNYSQNNQTSQQFRPQSSSIYKNSSNRYMTGITKKRFQQKHKVENKSINFSSVRNFQTEYDNPNDLHIIQRGKANNNINQQPYDPYDLEQDLQRRVKTEQGVNRFSVDETFSKFIKNKNKQVYSSVVNLQDRNGEIFRQISNEQDQPSSKRFYTQGDVDNENTPQVPLQKAEIRRYLHPQIEEQHPVSLKHFVPGYYSKNPPIYENKPVRLKSSVYTNTYRSIAQGNSVKKNRLRSAQSYNMSNNINQQSNQLQNTHGYQPNQESGFYQRFQNTNNSQRYTVTEEQNLSGNQVRSIRSQSSGNYAGVNLLTYKFRDEARKQWVGPPWKKF